LEGIHVIKKIAVTGIAAAALVLSAAAVAKGGGAAVFAPAGDLKWGDVPDRPGVKLAAVQGDPNKGASHFFVKLPAGLSVALHHHTPDHYVAVVSGTLTLNDGQDHTLPAGSYFSFTGKKQHTTKCNDGADCVLFVDARGKWDVVEEKPKK
jgi:quercetin dioxygenase-like cupin family protein